MSPNFEIDRTRWSLVSSGFHEIEIGWDRLESVGLLAPFLAPADTACFDSRSAPRTAGCRAKQKR